MDESSKKSDLGITTGVNEDDYASASTLYFSTLEKEIEQSKAHWSILVDHSCDTGDEEVNFGMSNEQEFRALQRHPTWGSFFANFSGDGISTGFGYDYGELVVGKKFAEGCQAELYEAQIKWNDAENAEEDTKWDLEYVLKVFKEGTLLKHVKLQLPEGLLQFHVEELKNWMSPTPKDHPRYYSQVILGILLKSGRFAFLMRKEHFDLRSLIERKMELKLSGEDQGAFSQDEAELMMYQVALGVEWLHNRDIVHRDLKASNVLVQELETGLPRWECYVADYECSVGVVGTTFFRAPEILLACKERKVNERPEVFSRAADVYSYAMTCYEILTGKLPFEGHPLSDNGSLLIDLVINQQLRPVVPIYVEDWTRELLDGCWQSDPSARPRIGEILNVLSTNSTLVKRREAFLKDRYGENYRY